MIQKQKKNMRQNQKKKLYLLIPVVIIIVIIIGYISTKNDMPNDGLKYNNNKSFVKKQKVNGIIFKNIKCSYDGKNSLISYTMINETKKKIYLNNYDIIVKDKNSVKITRIAAHVTQTLSPNESVEMANKVVGVDLTNAYYMELKLNTNKEKNE